MFNIHLLPASFGDAILVEYGDRTPRYILIDGGPYFVYEEVIKGIRRVAPDLKTLELLVITHIDIDHIDGIIVLLNQKKLPFKIKEVWFNGFNELQAVEDDLLGALQGEMLSILIDRWKLKHNKATAGGPVVVRDYNNPPVYKLTGKMKLTLISPGKDGLVKLAAKWKEEISEIGDSRAIEERLQTDHRYDEIEDDLLGETTIEQWQAAAEYADKSEANGSSIGFIAEYDGRRCLFAADTPTHYLLEALKPMLDAEGGERLHFDAWKLAHHGSKKSTHASLMQIISCPKILVSSDGKRYKHPDKECIAKWLLHKDGRGEIYFNYRTAHNERWDNANWKRTYGYDAFYPEEGKEGISVEL